MSSFCDPDSSSHFLLLELTKEPNIGTSLLLNLDLKLEP